MSKILFINGPRAGETAEFHPMDAQHGIVVPVMVSPVWGRCETEEREMVYDPTHHRINYVVRKLTMCEKAVMFLPHDLFGIAVMKEPLKPTREALWTITDHILAGGTAAVSIVDDLPKINRQEAEHQRAMKSYEFLKKVYEQGPRALRD
jgi:hypothetical protein